MNRYLGDDDLFTILAGIFGALTAALHTPTLEQWGKAGVFLTGASFTVFVGPFLCEQLNITSPYGIGAVLFLGGVLGNIILIRVINWAKHTDIIRLILDRYTAGGKHDPHP